jgi:hypothetical protein
MALPATATVNRLFIIEHREMHMSEDICVEQDIVGFAEVVELGTASDKTRGIPIFLGLLDGGLNWPNVFQWQS